MNELNVRKDMTRVFTLVLVICTTVLSAPADVKAMTCPLPPAQCQYDASVFDEHFYFIEGLKFEIDYKGTYLSFKCPEGVGFESQSMPRFSRAVRVQLVVLTQCAVPAAPFKVALAALNVTVLDKLLLRDPRGDLQSFHFTGLDVSALEVWGKERVALDEDALVPLGALTELWLVRVALAEPTLLHLPAALLRLHMESCNITEFATPALRRLSSLVYLRLHETTLTVAPDLSVAPALQSVSFRAPLNDLPSSITIKNLTSHYANSLEIVGECGALSRLEVSRAASAPPADWLARCVALTELSLSDTRLAALPADLLRAAPRLRSLTVRGCGLRQLPPELLTNARDLQEIDFSNNQLETLPEELLVAVRALRSLDLSNNRLSRAGARPALAPSSLHRLALDGNPLGDLCDRGSDALYRDGVSALFEMRSLRALGLARTGATRLCADWRLGMRTLARLDLRHNNISSLQASDLQWGRDVAAEVLLKGNPLLRATLSSDDYRAARDTPAPSHVTKFKMDATFECDCLVYWAARLARDRPDLPLASAQCTDGSLLARAPLSALVCRLRPHECAPRCACTVHGDALQVDCAGAGLARPPRPPPGSPPPARLLLANNSIAALRPDDFGPELRLLDLSGNRIADADARTAAALLAPPHRTLRLARNPLACRCGDALPAALHAHSARVLDFGEVRCADGRPLAELRPGEPCLTLTSRAVLGAAGGVLLLTASALAAALVRRPARLALKRFLLGRGLCMRWALREAGAADERAYRYDVFVSFSHHDERFVTERLVPALEAGARPYRLCLHYRDWPPGEWIPTQIARSVREARRTLLLVSSQWARSQWAQAEFRAAYALAQADARPRLVLLLLEEPAALRDLDPDVRAFLAANTYLRWDDPWFWRKLRHALPHGNLAEPTEPAAPVAPAASAASAAPDAPDAPDAPAAPAARAAPPILAAPAEPAALHTAPVA